MIYAPACRRRARSDNLLELRARLRAACYPLAEAVSTSHELLLVEHEQEVFEDVVEARYREDRRERLLWETDGREALAEQLWRLALAALAVAALVVLISGFACVTGICCWRETLADVVGVIR